MLTKINPSRIKEDIIERANIFLRGRTFELSMLYILYLATIFLTPFLISYGWFLGLSLAQ